MAESPRRARFDGSAWFALCALLLPLALYVLTLAPGLLNDDPAEYQLVLGMLGVAHPTGYPLYTLLGHLFTRVVPFGELAWRVNLFSAVAAAGAMSALYFLLRALDVAPLLALLGTLAFAVSADSWTYATIAQTYALNLLLMTLALYAFARYARALDRRALLALALVSGLGATHHSTFWLLLPALALGVLMLWRRARRLPLGDALLALGFFLLPLALYLYIPLRGEQLHAMVTGEVLGYPRFVTDGWVTPHYLPGWTNVVVGSFYASSTLGGASVDWPQQFAQYGAQLFRQFNLFPLMIVCGLVPLWRRHTLLVSVLLAAWLLNLVVVMRGVSAFAEPAGGLYTPTYLFALILIVLSASWLAARITRAAAMGLLVVLVLFNLWQNVGAHDPRTPAADRLMATQQLESALPNAVVLGAWSQITPLHYLQIVEGVRRDVSVVHAPLTDETVRELQRRARAEGRPLFVLRPSGELNRVATVPE